MCIYMKIGSISSIVVLRSSRYIIFTSEINGLSLTKVVTYTKVHTIVTVIYSGTYKFRYKIYSHVSKQQVKQ